MSKKTRSQPVPTSPPLADAARVDIINGLAPATSAAIVASLGWPEGIVLDPQLRCSPADPGQLETSLIEKYSKSELLATDCFALPNGNLELIRGLRTPELPVLLPSLSVGTPPFAIVADGRVAGARPPLLDLLYDDETRRRVEACSGAMIATLNLSQTIAMRMLGLAAAPISELLNCCGQWREKTVQKWKHLDRAESDAIRKIKQQIESPNGNIGEQSPEQAAADRRLRHQLRLDAILIVPAWDPHSFSPITHAGPTPLAAQLQWFTDQPGCNLGPIGIWQPPASTLARVRQAVRQSDQKSAHDMVLESLGRDVRMAVAQTQPPSQAPKPIADLAALERDIVAQQRVESEDFVEVRRTQVSSLAYYAMYDEKFVQPLRDLAFTTSDPVRRVQMESAAQLSRLLGVTNANTLKLLGAAEDDHQSLARSIDSLCKLSNAFAKTVDKLGDHHRGASRSM